MKKYEVRQKLPHTVAAVIQVCRLGLAATVLAAVVTASESSKSAAPSGWPDVRKAVIEHRYKDAIESCDVMVENARKALARDKADRAKRPGPDLVDILGLDEIALSAAASAKAQIYALIGDFPAAEKAVDYADAVINIGNPVSRLTRGFIREKQGDIAAARKFYLDDREAAATDHIISAGPDSGDRLALLAAKSGNLAEAKKYLGTAQTPTQQIALGLIALAEKDTNKAIAYFNVATALIQEPPKGNPSLPIIYCEEVPFVR